MAQPPPVPAASTPIPPPIVNLPIVNLRTGLATISFSSFLTEMWASIGGQAGIYALVQALTAAVVALADKVAIIFGMHGDGTLAADGVITITKTNGVAFGYFATGTDAAHLTGTLAPARIADDSLAYVKLVETSQAAVLGASAAGPVIEITPGDGISFAGSAVSFDVTTVPADTIPFAKLSNTVGPAILGADSAGPVVEITIGAGLSLTAGVLSSSFAGPAAVAVAALGAATAGKRAFVSDSTVTAAGNFGNVVVGLGANFCPVYADGAAWRIG